MADKRLGWRQVMVLGEIRDRGWITASDLASLNILPTRSRDSASAAGCLRSLWQKGSLERRPRAGASSRWYEYHVIPERTE